MFKKEVMAIKIYDDGKRLYTLNDKPYTCAEKPDNYSSLVSEWPVIYGEHFGVNLSSMERFMAMYMDREIRRTVSEYVWGTSTGRFSSVS
jgi:hypothetical protein